MSPETTLVAPFAGMVVSLPHAVNEIVGAGMAIVVIDPNHV